MKQIVLQDSVAHRELLSLSDDQLCSQSRLVARTFLPVLHENEPYNVITSFQALRTHMCVSNVRIIHASTKLSLDTLL